MSHRVLEDVRNPAFQSLLDLMRWVAAIVVFAAHLRHHVFVNPGKVVADAEGPITSLFYTATGLGFEALAMFVVLSGFLVGGLGVAKCRVGRFSLGTYSLDRFTRVFLPFVPAVLCGWALDTWASQNFSDLGLYDATHPLIEGRPSQSAYQNGLGGSVVMGNLAMLQYFFVRPVGSNIPLWYLSVEFWLYVVFGCGVALVAGSSWLRRALALLLIAAIAYLLDYRLAAWGVMWVLGLAAAASGGKRLQRPIISSIVLVAALATVLKIGHMRATGVTQWLAVQYLPPLAFAYFIFSMRGVGSAFLTRTRRLNGFMASFSFSLYLIHYPVMIALIGFAWKDLGFTGLAQGYQPNATYGIIVYASILVLTLALAFAFAWCTERRTDAVKAFLRSRLFRAPR